MEELQKARRYFFAALSVLALSGCYDGHYHHRYHDHGWDRGGGYGPGYRNGYDRPRGRW
ncbi:lipoprotein [Kozakia baliensis]|uniref:lipoprotein n=1 Tax=Kozakia baliensis TaxID=153496 RepID=UPI001314101F|nr:lipoprotein [Kozakia baliensis]